MKNYNNHLAASCSGQQRTSEDQMIKTLRQFIVGCFIAAAFMWTLGADPLDNWTSLNPKISSAVTYGNGRFVAAGNAGSYVSTDGTNWSLQLGGAGGGNVSFANGLFWSGDGWGHVMRSADGTNWISIAWPADSQTHRIAWGNNLYVAVNDLDSDNRNILTSTDGIKWVQRSASVNQNLRGAAFSQGQFVAVGDAGTIVTSTDGTTWTKRTSGTTANLYSVNFATGLFVACGSSATILTSTNGINWTVQTSGSSAATLYSTTFGNSHWTSVGDSGVILTSSNATNWVAQASGRSYTLWDVAYGNGTFAAMGDGLLLSPDGLSWTNIDYIGWLTKNDLTSVSYGVSNYVAVGFHGTIIRSPNGLDWTSQYSGTATNLYSVGYGNGLFVAVGQTILSSNDGITWTSRSTESGLSLEAVAFVNGRWLAVGDGGQIRVSTDGMQWTSAKSGSTAYFYSVAYGAGLYAIVGSGGTIRTSPDAVNWTARASGTLNDINGVLYQNGLFVAQGNGPAIYTSVNGISWKQQTLSGIYQSLATAAFGSGNFVIVGNNGQIISSKDGTNWLSKSVWHFQLLPGVAFGKASPTNGNFVAVGYGGTIAISDPLPISPSIIAQPTNVTVSCHFPAQFSVTADGTPPLYYQWKSNGVPILGATAPSYSVTPTNCQPPVSYSVVITNVMGAVASSVANLVVVDTNAPTITFPADMVIHTDPGQCSAVASYTVSAADDCSVVSLVVNPPSGSVLPKGTNLVVCTAIDCAGNSSVKSFKVTVIDGEAPVVTCPTNQVVTCFSLAGATVSFTPTAMDNCDGVIPVVSTPPSGSLFPPGLTLVNCVAVDSSGNLGTNSFTVSVVLTNTGIFSPTSTAYGRTYSDWSAAWWAWNFSLASTNHPLLDTGDVSMGQSGPVWFLGGLFGTGGTRVRNCTIPEGTALFFPIVNSWADNSDCPNFDSFSESQLRATAAGIQNQANGMTCTIDGVAVAGLNDSTNTPYRVQSPVFDYTLPAAHNLLADLFGASCLSNSLGSPIPVHGAVADGVFLLLPPLAVGSHVIHFSGAVGTPASFSQDVTYNIIVAPNEGNGGVQPPASTLFGKSYGEWSASWWQWCFSFPPSQHPLFDTADASTGQTGPVWFLGGTLGGTLVSSGPVSRSITIPDGKFLYFPIINIWADNTDCPNQDPFTETQLRALAKGNEDLATNLTCTIDGLAVSGLANVNNSPYRCVSPVFDYTVPGSENYLSFLGYSCYTNASNTPILVSADAVSDGVFLMVSPLSPGSHTIHFSGAIGNSLNLSVDVIYHITVSPPSLNIGVTSNLFTISWPQTGNVYQLQQSEVLSPANWLPVAAPISVSGGNLNVQTPQVGTSRFFRLAELNSSTFGRSEAEWQEAYWRWFYGKPQPVPATDANGNAVIGNVVLLDLPSAPGDGTPGITNLTLRADQAFVLPLWNLLGNSYTSDSGLPPDEFISKTVFQTLDLSFQIDGLTIINGTNLMNYFSQSLLVPPITDNAPPANAFIWFQSIALTHPPLSPGSHVLTLDAKNTDLVDLFGLVFEFHNTWNIQVQPVP